MGSAGRTIEKGVDDELAVPLHEVVDVAKDSTVKVSHDTRPNEGASTYHMMGKKNTRIQEDELRLLSRRRRMGGCEIRRGGGSKEGGKKEGKCIQPKQAESYL